MTGYYEWRPIPHIVDVKCLNCNGIAKFEFAEIIKIEKKTDIIFFENNKNFEYKQFEYNGQKWHAAIFFRGLIGITLDSISKDELPSGYSIESFDHSKYLKNRTKWPWGVINCSKCFLIRKHKLSWPKDAYYAIEFKEKILWAFNREMLIEIKDYILSIDRSTSNKSWKWGFFFRYIPTLFKLKKSRHTISKKIDCFLE